MFGEVHNIVPSQTPPYECLVDSCLTLSQFAQNSTNYIASNTTTVTLFISEGHHILDVRLSVSDIANLKFAMQPKDNTNLTFTPVITCAKFANFNFTNISGIHLHGLKFISCNTSTFKFIHQLTIKNLNSQTADHP